MDFDNRLSSWERMVDASKFYKQQGYEYHPVEWAVEDKYNRVTYDGPSALFTDDKYFVGSAEQGFIKDYNLLHFNTFYFGISPCVRLTDYLRSDVHNGYFLKLELFYKGSSHIQNMIAAEKIVSDANTYFKHFSPTKIICVNDHDCDIEIHGLEVGSYGIRDTPDYKFVYGTGVAEPRLTKAINNKRYI